MSAFTGRAAELAELDSLLPAAVLEVAREAPGPVVISAVSGTAGVGKTALAVRWAHRARDAFPDGQLYVDLRGYDPGDPVTATEALAGFLRALGVAGADIPPEEAGRAAWYRSLVADKRLLVVLDNAATIEQVRPLLPGAGTVMVMVTSRDSLAGLIARDGAHRLDLDLLPAAEAVTLLRTLIGSRVDADPQAAELLASQCARLPLALRVAAELAAARPDMPLAALTAELAGQKDRLELLDPDGDPHGAVASVFSWSYRYLLPPAAELFRLLGLHPGPSWDRHAAAALGAFDVAQCRQLLGKLARAHLIQPAGPDRYSMHSLLRAYAAGLATTIDSDQRRHEALTRLFDYYLATCGAAMDHIAPGERQHRPARPPDAVVPALADQDAARAWLQAELPTLTAVAAHTATCGWPSHTTRLAATLFRHLATGSNTDGLTIYTHALNAARDCGDTAAQARTLGQLSFFHSRQGRHQLATDLQQQALALASSIGDRPRQAITLTNLGNLSYRQGNYQQAITHYQQAAELGRELDDQTIESHALGNLGHVYLHQGRYQEAVSYLQQALERSGAAGDWVGHCTQLVTFGAVLHRQGHAQQAAGHLQQALTISRQIGDRTDEAEALTRLGEISCWQGDLDRAATYHREALDLYREIGDRAGEADALNGTGETLLAGGQPGQARACHTTALSLTRQTGDRYQQARAHHGIAEACAAAGDSAQADEHRQQALSLYAELGIPWAGQSIGKALN